MNWDLAIVLFLLVCTIVMFALNRPRMDAAALIMMTLLPLTGVITVSETLAGLSDPNIVLIGALFVIGEGLVRTGVAQRLGDALVRRAGQNEARLIIFLMLMVAAIGTVISSTGVVAIFIPAVLRVARNTKVSPSRLMMPLSVGALVSGMLTLIATPPNLIIHAQLIRAGYDGLHFFSLAVFGVPILIVSIIYMVLARHRLSPQNTTFTNDDTGRPTLSDWVHEYELVEKEYRFRVKHGSPWIGKQLSELGLRSKYGMNILAIERQRRFATAIVGPAADTILEVGDVLFVDFREPVSDVSSLCERLRLDHLPLADDYFTDTSQTLGMAELMIPAESELVGKTAMTSLFRSVYQLSIIGIKRGKTPLTERIQDERFRPGDTLLVAGPWKAITRLRTDPGQLIVLHVPADLEDVIALPSKAPLAISTLLIVITLMITGVVPNVQAALIGCLLLGLFRCIDMNAVYRSIQWPTIFLIVGMLPFSIALQNTGGVDLAVQALLNGVGENITFMLVAVYAVTALLGLFISNTATAVLMAPVAISLATQLGMPPHAFGVTVALASSAAFMTPVSSPVNALVIGPGNYRFVDFIRIGVPLFFVVMVVSVLLVRLVFV